jgi:hypothetical protein
VPAKSDLFLLYQMGTSEEYIWYSVVGVFLSEAALRGYAAVKDIAEGLSILESGGRHSIVLPEPIEFVAVKSSEGAVPDVEFEQAA